MLSTVLRCAAKLLVLKASVRLARKGEVCVMDDVLVAAENVFYHTHSLWGSQGHIHMGQDWL